MPRSVNAYSHPREGKREWVLVFSKEFRIDTICFATRVISVITCIFEVRVVHDYLGYFQYLYTMRERAYIIVNPVH